jgi:FKBP12-rapamycin complex-associated protein
VVSQDISQMKFVRDKLLEHIGAIYKDCRIEQNDMEAEGLGLRPLSLAENMGKSERNILARRYYRLGQWSEALQGGYWLTVSLTPPYE